MREVVIHGSITLNADAKKKDEREELVIHRSFALTADAIERQEGICYPTFTYDSW